MRSFLGFALFATVAVAILAIVLVPVIVGPLVASAVRAASPFGETSLDVQVDVNALALIVGTVDRIHVTAADLDVDGTTVDDLDVTVTRVSTTDRSFAAIDGALSGIAVPTDIGGVVDLERVDLSGPSDDVLATARLTPEAAVALLTQSLTDAGLAPDGVELIDGGVGLVLFGQRVDVPLGVVDGALVLPGIAGGSELVVFAPEADAPWRLTGVVVTPSGILIDAQVDAGGVLVRE